MEVSTGLNAGVQVELTSSPLKVGDEVVFGVTEVARSNGRNDAGKSPFMPTPERRGPQGGGSAANRARAAQAK